MAAKLQHFLTALLLLLHPRALAQDGVQSSITVQLYGPNLPPLEQAEILGFSHGMTTAKLVCDLDSDAAGCGQQLQNVYTFGPGSLGLQASLDGQYTVTDDCLTAAAAATCQHSESAYLAVFPPSSTVINYTTSYTTTYGSAEIKAFTLSIIGGADKLPGTTYPVSATTSSTSPVTHSTVTAVPASSMSSTPMQTALSDAALERPVYSLALAAYVIAVSGYV